MSARRALRSAALAAGLIVANAALAAGERFHQEGDVALTGSDEHKAGIGWKLAIGDPGSRLRVWELKPKVQATLSSWLESAVTYKFARGRGGGGEWSTSHTLELDLTPRWNLGELAKFQATQRLGIGKPASGPLRYRHHAIPKVEWKAGCLPTHMSIENSVEMIRDLRQNEWVEAKITPLKLKFPARHGSSWSLAYQQIRKRAGDAWTREHVLIFAIGLDFRSSHAAEPVTNLTAAESLPSGMVE